MGRLREGYRLFVLIVHLSKISAFLSIALHSFRPMIIKVAPEKFRLIDNNNKFDDIWM